MLSGRIKRSAAMILTLLLAQAAPAQQSQPPAQQPSRSSSQSGSDFVEERAFKGRVFEIKHRDPLSIQRSIAPLASGFKGATMSVNQEFRTLTVRDFPENIATIEEAIKRLDTPEPPRPSIQMRIHILIASEAAGGTESFPQDLGDVIKQLQSTFRYKSYSLMASEIQNTKESHAGISNEGVVATKLFNVSTPEGNPIFYGYDAGPIGVERSSSGPAVVQIGAFSFRMRFPLNLGSNIQYQNVGFKSAVSVREGEKVIVGTTTMGDKAVIIVLSARVNS